MTVIVAALHQEFTEMRRNLAHASAHEEAGTHFFSGTIAGKPVSLVVSGVGFEKAERSTRWAIERFSPKRIISLGYAGGLSPNAGPGAIILPDTVGQVKAEAAALQPDAELLALARSAASRLHYKPLGGLLLTVPALVAKREDKKSLHARTGAVAVDMESAAVGAACRQARIPIVYFRCVTDGVDDEIPNTKEISAAFRGRIRPLPFVLGLVKRPSVALAIWRLYRRAHRASNILACLVRAFCEALP